MCVIAVAIKKEIDLPSLLACEESNPHGGGVAWVENGSVHWKKNLRASAMLELVKNKPFPHVYHFRIASVGAVTPNLCHPFAVEATNNDQLEGSAKSALFHNGTVGDWRGLAHRAGVTFPESASDTMVVARMVAKEGESVLRHLSGYWALLKDSGEVKLFGGFKEKDGVHYSNLYWTYNRREAYAAHERHQSKSGGCFYQPRKQSDFFEDEEVAEPIPVDDADVWYEEYLKEKQASEKPRCPECDSQVSQTCGRFYCKACGHCGEIGEDKFLERNRTGV